MAFDYTSLAAMVVAQIADYGRPITLVTLDETVSDGAKPWRGNTAPRAAAAELSVSAVFLDGDTVRSLGVRVDPSNRKAQFAIVDATTIEASALDGQDVDEIQDAGNVWSVENTWKIQPGDTALLYAFEVKQ